jgi:uncharacterized protein (UPF0332 family)
MVEIKWCVKKKGGISIIEPNSNISKVYIKKAEDALESMRINTIKEWKIATSYYSLYFSLYSILTKIGIKSEIHSCTIEFAKTFLKDYFYKKDFDFLEDSLKARIDSQYYVNKTISEEQFMKMMKQTPNFLIKCKSILIKLNEKRITEIRESFKNHFLSNNP